MLSEVASNVKIPKLFSMVNLCFAVFVAINMVKKFPIYLPHINTQMFTFMAMKMSINNTKALSQVIYNFLYGTKKER